MHTLAGNNTWSDGISHELSFWDYWLGTQGDIWKEDYQRRIDPNAHLSDYHRRFIDHLPDEVIRILDVGAGPLTTLGKKHPTKTVLITPTDALAKEYNGLLQKHKIIPPVRTIYARAEELTAFFEECSFELVGADNSIDHCENPLRAIMEMARVCKVGSYILLNHVENEGYREGYAGFHYWDFTMENGSFLIKGKNGENYDVVKELGNMITCEECRINGDWIQVHLRKYRHG